MSRPSPNSATFCGTRTACWPSLEQRDADVAAGDHLGGELADDLAELHGEQRAADAAHDLAGALDHARHLFGRLLLEHRGRESEMLVATGSASCVQTGIVAATHRDAGEQLAAWR